MPIEQSISDLDANCLLCGHEPSYHDHDHVPEEGGRICRYVTRDGGKPCNCAGYVRLPAL
jgi:hypothetical protein